jgi:hypothetical protein
MFLPLKQPKIVSKMKVICRVDYIAQTLFATSLSSTGGCCCLLVLKLVEIYGVNLKKQNKKPLKQNKTKN